MVGRPHLIDDIAEALEVELPTIHVTSTKNSDDIVHYVESSIRKSSVLRRASAKFQGEIVEKLVTGAQGMFLWVDLMLKELLKKRSESTMRRSLAEAPKGLTQMLRHVLEGFSSTLTEDAPDDLNELLAWTTCAQRSLTLGELDTILKLKSSNGDGMIYLEGALRKQYASFFSLTREDGLSTADLQNIHRIQAGSDSEQEHDEQEESFNDVNNETDFDSNPYTTQVTFCHASIGDFFRDESQGKVSAGDGCPAIGVDFNEAKISVLDTCLNLLCDDAFARKVNDGVSMMDYACQNWYQHLRAVDLSKAKVADKKAIVNLLLRMLKHKSFMTTWVGAVLWTFFNEDNVLLMRKWLEDSDILEQLSVEDREWIRSTSEAPANIFLPVVEYIAHQWLQKSLWIPFTCWAIVYAFLQLQKGTPLSVSPTSFTKARDIIDVAEWAQFEKTALWHRRLAMVLRECGMYDEALDYFTKALELDDKLWLARSGMALVHFYKKEYDKSIELDKVNEGILQKTLADDYGSSEDIKSGLHIIQEEMGAAYFRLGDKENSLVCYQKALSNNGGCDRCIVSVLTVLDEKKLHNDIIELLKSLDNGIPGQEYTGLTESLWKNYWDDADYYEIVAEAARETDELQFLLDAYRSAITAARKKLKTVVASQLELCLATLYYKYCNDQRKAVRIWENIIETFKDSRTEEEMVYVKRKTSICLARHYFQQAFEAEKGSPDADKNVKKLERLAKFKTRSTKESPTIINASPPAIMLGVWYRLNDRPEDARACFRPSIREALRILSDDDPNNDRGGFMDLANVLLAAGDDKNAIAVLQALGSSEDQESTDGTEGTKSDGVKDSDPDSEDDYGELVQFSCDGPCHRVFASWQNTSQCRYCIDTGFCENCIKLLKTNTMPLNVCSPWHEWLVIPPPAKKTQSGKLLIDDTLVDVEHWQKSLKQQWQV